MKAGLCIVLLLAMALPVRAQDAPNIDYETAHLSKVVTAVRTAEPIVIDGRLDERAW